MSEGQLSPRLVALSFVRASVHEISFEKGRFPFYSIESGVRGWVRSSISGIKGIQAVVEPR